MYTNQFLILNVYLDMVQSKGCVKFTIKTRNGQKECMEWLDNKVPLLTQKKDGHLRTNQAFELVELFDVSNKPNDISDDRIFPFDEILEQVDEILKIISEFDEAFC
jgi:hypothetical protein